MAYSQDGITWISITSPFSNQCSGIAYSQIQNKWMALGIGANTMAYSLNGLDWIGLGNSVFTTQGNRIAYSQSQNLWMATGVGTNNLAYSHDGTRWTYSNTPFNTQANDVVYASNLNRWVAVGATTNTIAYSSDGINWTGLGESIFVAVGQGYSINYDPGVGQFIVGGQGVGFTFGYSLNGINWIGHSSPFSTEIQGAAYGQGNWIITGNPTFGNVPFASATPPNVISGTWNTYPSQVNISGGEYIVYHSALNRWVTVGSGLNSIVYSDDGLTWNGAGSPFNSGFIVAMSNTLFIPPSNVISGSLSGNIIYNTDTIINTNSSVVLDGNLTIQGDLYIFGSLTLSNTSTLNVTGLLSISGPLIYSASSSPIQAQTIYANSSLSLVLDSKPKQTTTIIIAQYQSIVGQFNSFSLVVLNGDIGAECLTTNYGQSALSVLVDINPCLSSSEFPVGSGNSNHKTATERMPIWAIALTACLVGIIGIGGAIAIVIFMRRSILTRTKKQTEVLRKRMTENMQYAARNIHDNPTL
jgi:hypothetical protein